jgi:P27 family predicted phage terminase small subunit
MRAGDAQNTLTAATRHRRPTKSFATTAPVRSASARKPAAKAHKAGVSLPDHLSKEAKRWWASVVADYELEPHHLHLLQAACEAWDRCQQAREVVSREGITFRTANGDVRTHPAVTIEKDARIVFARLVRELDLDAEPPAERSRPPALGSNRR